MDKQKVVMRVVIRVLAGELGGGMVFVGLRPYLGLVPDWDTLSSGERMIASVVMGIVIGTGVAFLLWATGLFEKIIDVFD